MYLCFYLWSHVFVVVKARNTKYAAVLIGRLL